METSRDTRGATTLAPRPAPPIRRPTGGPWSFFALVFALAAPFWLLGAVVPGPAGAPMGLPASALQFVCPGVAALILRYRRGGGVPLRRGLGTLVAPRPVAHGWTWYAIALGLVPVALVLAYRVLWLAGATPTGPVTPVTAAPALLAVFAVSAAFEEAGWMGYALPRLRRRRNALSAGLILGVVWAVFHLVPLFEAGRPPAWIAGWFVGTVAARVLIVWLCANARALLPAILLHTTLNLGGSFFPGYAGAAPQIALGVILALVAVVVVAVCGRHTLTGRPGAGR